MNNLESVLWEDLFEEMSALPAGIPEYAHSKSYEKAMSRLLDKMRGDRYHPLTRRTAIAVLVAAILLAFAIIGYAALAYRDFNVRSFFNHYEYTVSDVTNGKPVTELKLGYIPEGYELEEEESYSLSKRQVYVQNGNAIEIRKCFINTIMTYDNDLDYERINHNGIEYVYGKTKESDFKRLIWNDGDYLYFIKGTLSEEELFKIADGIEKN